MKKWTTIFSICLLVGLFVADTIFAENTPKQLTIAKDKATIIRIEGDVQVQRKNTLNWIDAEVDMDLQAGSRLTTGVTSYCELSFNYDEKTKKINIVRIEPETTIVLNKVSPSETEIGLPQGEIDCLIERLEEGSTFEVKTPTTVCGSRGTGFSVKYNPHTVVLCYEHAVYVIRVDDQGNPIGKARILKEGFQQIIDKLEVSDATRLSPEDKEKWNAWRKDVGKLLGGYVIKEGSTADPYTPPGDEGGGGDDDLGDDVGDNQNNAGDNQGDANDDQYSDREDPDSIDTDGDGYVDSEDAFPDDEYDWQDSDSDTYGDNEDAFPDDSTVHEDTQVGDVTILGYGSRHQMREKLLEKMQEQDLRDDVGQLEDDIYYRDMDAKIASIADHQAGKVMTDRWGNRVRVDEYIFKPDNKTVQFLSLNLRTAGPNKGVSTFDFQVAFKTEISGDLKDLPWDDYMHNPEMNEYFNTNNDDDSQLIVYETENEGEHYNPQDYNYPLPDAFSLEVKSPVGNSVKATETYSDIIYDYVIGDYEGIWYQKQTNDTMSINGTTMNVIDPSQTEMAQDWGDDWNAANRYTFLEELSADNDGDGAPDQWLMGMFYLIEDNGSLVSIPEDLSGADYFLDNEENEEFNGIRDCINPDFNVEMVFFSSEFEGNEYSLSDIDAMDDEGESGGPSYSQQLDLYQKNPNIDVITIPEITDGYTTPKPTSDLDKWEELDPTTCFNTVTY
jgi:hypothetical protein